MRRISRTISGSTFWIVLGALIVGFLAGQARLSDPAGAQDVTPNPSDVTATREAEIEELERLQAQAAGSPVPVVCTPAPTATTTPTPAPTATPTPVPPVAAGTPVSYGDSWTVTVMGLGLSPNIGRQVATGVFATVELRVRNEGTQTSAFPFDEFVLVDSSGRTFNVSVSGSVEARLRGPAGWGTGFDPGIPADAVVVFDVATDAGESFILQSTEDPTFRVQVSRERSG